MIKKAALLLICLPILHQAVTLQVMAKEISIVVEGNGEASQNETTVESKNTTTVEQNNNAQIENNIETNTNTGGNSANDNHGEANIQTGGASSSTSVANENINTNTANVNNCCTNSSSVKISGNGSNSQNNINVGSSATNHVDQTNNVNIQNTVKVQANTGKNWANRNSGDVTIKTGDIKAETDITNKNINNSYAKVEASEGVLYAKISNNGEDSINTIEFENSTLTFLHADNNADVRNNVFHNLNSGRNSANDNIGGVAILTGDIESKVAVKNKNINSNEAITTCVTCQPEKPEKPEEEKPEKPEKPSKEEHHEVMQPSSGGQGGPGGQGPANGAILPVTGSFPLTYLFTVVFFLLFMLGLYLRFHSGNAPPKLA